jgi:hypothetical protein
MNEQQFQVLKDRQRGYKSDSPKGVICECIHCGDRWGAGASGKCALTCKNCGTKEGRERIRKENAKILSKK